MAVGTENPKMYQMSWGFCLPPVVIPSPPKPCLSPSSPPVSYPKEPIIFKKECSMAFIKFLEKKILKKFNP
jgi:hypothetical protein